MEPIEIELRMKQNLEAESKKAEQGVRQLSKTAKDSKAEMRESLALQRKIIAQLREELKPLEAEFKKVNFGTHDTKVLAERKRLGQIVSQMKTELKGEEAALKELEKTVASSTTKMTSLRTQMQTVRDAMGQLRLEGKENTAEFKRLEEQLGSLGTAYREMRTLEKAVSTGGTQLEGFMTGLNALSGAVSAGGGAIALFNNDSEKMAEIQTKVQGIMAISIGLMQVSNALHSTSAFRITTVTKVKHLWAAANLRVATTLGISTAAAQVLMATLTLGLSVAITAAVALFSKFISSQREAAAQAKEFNQAVASGSADQISSFERLRISYQNLNGDLQAQTKFLKDNKEEFDRLGVAISDVNEAERAFSNEGAEAFRQAMLERAKSIALMEKAAERYKEIVEKQLSLDDGSAQRVSGWQKFITRMAAGSDIAMADKMRQDFAKSNRADVEEEVARELAEWEEMVRKAMEYKSNSAQILKTAGIDDAQELIEGTKAYWEARKKAAQTRLEAMKDAEQGSALWQEHLAELKLAEGKLQAWQFGAKDDKGLAADDSFKRAMKRKAAQMQMDIDQARINAMDEGIERTLAQNQLNHDKELAQLESQKQELLEQMRAVEKEAWKAAGGQGEFRSKITQLPEELNQLFITQTQQSIDNLQRANNQAIEKLLKSAQVDKTGIQAIVSSAVSERQSKLDALHQYEALQLAALAKEEQKLDAQTYKKRQKQIREQTAEVRKNIEQEAHKYLESIPESLLKDAFGEFDLTFMNLDAASMGQLNKLVARLEKLTLDKTELISLGLTETQIAQLETLLSAFKDDKLGDIDTAKFAKLRDVFSEIGSALGRSTDEMTAAIGQMVTALGGVIGTLSDVNATGFQKVSGIVSLAITAGNYLAQIRRDEMSKTVDAQRQVTSELAEQIKLEQEINAIRRERAASEAQKSAFIGPDFTKQYKGALDTAKESRKELDNAMGKLMQNAIFTAEGTGKRRLFGKKTGTYSFSMNDIFGDFKTAPVGKGWSDIAPLLFGSVGGLATNVANSGGGFKEVLGALLDPAGLFGGYADGKAQKDAFKKVGKAFEATLSAMGKTSADMARMSTEEWVDFFSLMDSLGYISDDGTKMMIESAKAAAEEYAKAMDEMREIIGDVAGDLGSMLGDTLVQAFKRGSDAAEDFKEVVNDVITSMFMQRFVSSYFEQYFEDLQKDMEASMDGGDKNWSDDVERFWNKMEKAIPGAMNLIEDFDKQMQARGWAGLGGEEESSREAAKKGFAAMSQDSADILDGRLMAISGSVYSIIDKVAISHELDRESLVYQRAAMAYLETIADNTAFCRYLLPMSNVLDDISKRGVKIQA